MRVALGFKARTGRAVLVAVGFDGTECKLIERTEIKLLPDGAFAPYHAAAELKPELARASVQSSVAAAHRLAQHAIRDALTRSTSAGHDVSGCGVLIGAGMPDWSTDEILAVHVRMHKAEGELFRNVLVAGAQALKLKLTTLPQQSPFAAAAALLGLTDTQLESVIAVLGKQAGPP